MKEEMSSRQQSPGDIAINTSDIVNAFCHPTILENVSQLLIEQKRAEHLTEQ